MVNKSNKFSTGLENPSNIKTVIFTTRIDNNKSQNVFFFSLFTKKKITLAYSSESPEALKSFYPLKIIH